MFVGEASYFATRVLSSGMEAGADRGYNPVISWNATAVEAGAYVPVAEPEVVEVAVEEPVDDEHALARSATAPNATSESRARPKDFLLVSIRNVRLPPGSAGLISCRSHREAIRCPPELSWFAISMS